MPTYRPADDDSLVLEPGNPGIALAAGLLGTPTLHKRIVLDGSETCIAKAGENSDDPPAGDRLSEAVHRAIPADELGWNLPDWLSAPSGDSLINAVKSILLRAQQLQRAGPLVHLSFRHRAGRPSTGWDSSAPPIDATRQRQAQYEKRWHVNCLRQAQNDLMSLV